MINKQTQLVILDRDGVINEDSDDYIKNEDEWTAIPNSLEAIARLNCAGVIVAIASNQSGIGRGLLTHDDLDSIHSKLRTELGALGGHIDHIQICPHHPDDGCLCRKPFPGMLLSIVSVFGVSPSATIFVGDAKRDVDAAQAANITPVLVYTGKGRDTKNKYPELESIAHFDDLADVVDHILEMKIT